MSSEKLEGIGTTGQHAFQQKRRGGGGGGAPQRHNRSIC